MYRVSELMNQVLISTVSITIIDGQSQEAITNHINTEYNPCLPMTINADKRINITFTSNITSFIDWFPVICRNGTGYVNEYMFDGAQQWNFENLIVEDYGSESGYGLVRMESYFGDITCIACRFKNISFNESKSGLFESYGSMNFDNSHFEGISVNSTVLILQHSTDAVTGGIRDFALNDCVFMDIAVGESIIVFEPSLNEVEYSLA